MAHRTEWNTSQQLTSPTDESQFSIRGCSGGVTHISDVRSVAAVRSEQVSQQVVVGPILQNKGLDLLPASPQTCVFTQVTSHVSPSGRRRASGRFWKRPV